MSIIVYATQGSGKTKNAEALLHHYGLTQIFDEWRQGDELPDNALALTNVPCSNAISLEDALSMKP